MARKSAKQVGALWRHQHEKVGTFLTGVLDLGGLGEVPIAVFRNDRKEEGTKQPDYRIVLSERTGADGPEAGADDGSDPLADGNRLSEQGETMADQRDGLPY